MTVEKAIELMENEKTCIIKADTYNKNCAKCELLRDTKDLLLAYDMAIQALKQTKWIPCSERMPKDRRVVLVTAYWHETYQVMMASYFGDGLWWCIPFNNNGELMQRLKPKAWMPLPKPYKAERTEE